MNRISLLMLAACCIVLCSSHSTAADKSLIGEWFPMETSQGGLGGTRHFKTNGTMLVTFGAAVVGKYQLETNGETKTLVMPGPDAREKLVRMDFAISNNTLRLDERKGRQQLQLTRVKGTGGEGLIGQWTGRHYTGRQQIMDFTTNMDLYLSIPFQSVAGLFTLNGNTLTEEYQGKRLTSKWDISNDVLTLTPSTGEQTEKYKRKESPPAGVGNASFDLSSPPGRPLADKSALKKGEKEKIDALFKQLESLKDATFIRNDRAYQPKEAAAMMRNKWETLEEDIKTAAEFIEKIMTVSTSGTKKPYLIRFKDGKEIKCADFLNAELKKIETAPREKEKP